MEAFFFLPQVHLMFLGSSVSSCFLGMNTIEVVLPLSEGLRTERASDVISSPNSKSRQPETPVV